MSPAVVKIWDIKSRLDRVIDYVVNGEKTEEQLYVSGINCQPEYACSQMNETKSMYAKTKGILAFHAYQSFAKGEVTPELAHKIGLEFAKRMWGERFEVVVATHLNTNCIHNHFVLNSVSFEDGKRYYDNKENYKRMREVSDALCAEHNLSVVENPGASTVNYKTYMDEKEGRLTKDAIFRRDIDECILISLDQKDFLNQMKKRGYTFDFTHKYATIKHKDFERARRLSSLGDEYSPKSLKRRIDESWRRYRIDVPAQDNLAYAIPLGYQDTYVRFVAVITNVKERPNENRRAYKLFYEEVRKLDRLIEQQNLLCGNDIDTAEQLTEYKRGCTNEISELEEARRKLRNKLRVAERNGNGKETAELKEHISNLSERLKKLRRDITVCNRIEKQKPVIDYKLNEINKEYSRQNNRYR